MKKTDWFLWAMVMNLLLLPMGCGSARIGPQSGAADRVREMNTLKEENQALRFKVRELEARDISSTSSRSGMEINLPTPVSLVLGTGSVIRTGADPVAEIRLRTTDARGHFVQVTGPARILLVSVDQEGEPVSLADQEVGHRVLQEMLREGFMGTAYAVDIPLGDTPDFNGSVMVRAIMEDTRLSEPLETDGMIPVLEGRNGGSGQ